MSAPPTEQIHPRSSGLDTLSDAEILRIFHGNQVEAARAVAKAAGALEKGAAAMAEAIRSGNRLVYAAAGSSGLQGMADGLEITPTFGVPISQIRILRAGGLEDMSRPKGHAEDNAEAARADADVIGAGDCVICLAASGNTTYPVTIMNIANERGAVTISISNNPDTLLLRDADIAVFLPTPPEVIAGSTRLGAGTAQKIALNMMSSLMGVRLGHVMDGLMVNVIANNEKLFRRAENIVMRITGCDRARAAGNLKRADGGVKEAVLLAEGAPDLETARNHLVRAEQNLRNARTFVKRQ
ncbi:MAG: N-acetylmuramic acid 6-phosphate etherase [Rhodobacteraceae bacterium]|nr:N-acetylmuramic acid 6-phosphate etherase [Paracoccaceae bacterium]